MSVITMPADLSVGQASMAQVRYDIVEQSESTGAQATRLLGPPRWQLSMRSQPVMDFAQAGKWEALVYGARGRVNHIAAYDPGRVAPAGTLRGSPRLLDPVAAGATSASLGGGTAGTLLAGDLLQISTGLGTSQTVKVIADTVSSPAASGAFVWSNAGTFVWSNGGTFVWSNDGSIAVTFEPPLRAAYVADTPVAWSRPVIYCKAQAANQGGSYTPGFIGQGGYALDLLEAFS